MVVDSIIPSADNLHNKIYTLRDTQVMLDEDLAELYNVVTKVLNQAVKRNVGRFPEHFMFQLTKPEFGNLRSQFVTLEKGRGIHRKYLPYAFTEQGVAMLSGVLKSDVAIKVSIQIMTAFVQMRRFITANSPIFHRLNVIEKKQMGYDKKFELVFDAIQTKGIKPTKGIFFDGEIFDAYKLVSDIIRSAHSTIILFDNYIDDSVLILFTKRRKGVQVILFTKDISTALLSDLAKYNAQYPPLVLKEFKQAHDRFLIIDDKDVYHFGASLKDLGKKWFAFSRFDKEAFRLLNRLDELKQEGFMVGRE